MSSEEDFKKINEIFRELHTLYQKLKYEKHMVTLLNCPDASTRKYALDSIDENTEDGLKVIVNTLIFSPYKDSREQALSNLDELVTIPENKKQFLYSNVLRRTLYRDTAIEVIQRIDIQTPEANQAIAEMLSSEEGKSILIEAFSKPKLATNRRPTIATDNSEISLRNFLQMSKN